MAKMFVKRIYNNCWAIVCINTRTQRENAIDEAYLIVYSK